MADFSAQDVKRLRDSTGVGMMDAKRALTENDGDVEAATKWLLEKGLAKSAERSDRENTEGAVALGTAGRAASLVQLKSETDFVAKSPDFQKLVQDAADVVAAEGEGAIESLQGRLDELKISLKENLEWGRVVRFDPAEGNAMDTYLHVQNDRGVNGVLVEIAGGTPELAHEVALHIAFAKPSVLDRSEVPQAEVDEQRELLLTQTKNEGKPEQAWPKIVEGRLTGWFARLGEPDKGKPGGALLDQPWTSDEKQTVTQALGDAKIVRYAQVLIG
jgi:elongation factor Ts